MEKAKGALPSDELWALDLETATWTQHNIRGVSPGPLSYGAAACVGNKAYFFGGWTGSEPTNNLHLLDVVTSMWEPCEDNADGPRPSPRFGHSLIACGPELIMYGGRDDKHFFHTLAIYDTATELWSTPATRGDICRERAFHTSLLWGRNLIIALGAEGESETGAVNMLNLDSLYWDSWDGNVSRRAAAVGLLEGKLYVAGGEESGEKRADMFQFNMGGFMLTFDVRATHAPLRQALGHALGHPPSPPPPPPPARRAPLASRRWRARARVSTAGRRRRDHDPALADDHHLAVHGRSVGEAGARRGDEHHHALGRVVPIVGLVAPAAHQPRGQARALLRGRGEALRHVRRQGCRARPVVPRGRGVRRGRRDEALCG